jgi:sigma-B regulation protein RsbU (phosphoserine phosphatase)
MPASSQSKPPLYGLYVRNFTANFLANVTIALLNFVTPLEIFEEWRGFLLEGGWSILTVFIPIVFSLAFILQYLVQRPVAVYLRRVDASKEIHPALLEKCRRRVLNLPVILGLINLMLWIGVTAVFTPVIVGVTGMTATGFLYIFFRTIIIGLVATYIGFFLIDEHVKKQLIPYFFPKGKLANISNSIRLPILLRIRVLFGVGTGMPMIILVGTLIFALLELNDASKTAAEFGRELLIFVLGLFAVFYSIALFLNILSGKSIVNPIKEMIGVVHKVREGDFHQSVSVVSNDELGILGDGLNEMTEGLIERDRMRHSLNLAKEVQQALLPQSIPRIKGLDIAARSIYCDETGGDYFDFLDSPGSDQGRLAILVGDVSGHGISSAMLMATARAFLRQRSASDGRMIDIVEDVNRRLSHDVEDSGSFMTLFFLRIDTNRRSMKWVRAGHDPALFYDPQTDSFEELRGEGTVLGVNPEERFHEYRKDHLQTHQVILIGTDGIWEARNSRNEMFGKQAVHRIIRRDPKASAERMLNSCFQELKQFQGDTPLEDDVTLVIVKINEMQSMEVR